MIENNAAPSDEIDLTRLFESLRRNVWIILGVTVVVAGLTFFISSEQPPKYEATSSVIATRSDTSSNIVNTTLLSAPLLPQGAVDKAVHSRTVVNEALKIINQSKLSQEQKTKIITDLNEELRRNVFKSVTVRAKLDAQLTGVYDISATGDTPREAKVIVDAMVQSLLAWDVSRATYRLTRAIDGLTAQASSLDQQIKTASSNELDVLKNARQEISKQLAEISVFQNAATGALSQLSDAELPIVPVSPKPLRNAALAGLLALLLTSGVAILLDTLRKRIMSEEDLLHYSIPVLGKLPKLKDKDLKSGMIESVRTGSMYEPIGFLRVSLFGYSEEKECKRLVVSSARSGEGKSSVAASLAQGLASSGQKVLIIDFDLHRPTQMKLWNQGRRLGWKNLLTSEDSTVPSRDIQGAMLNPQHIQVMSVGENVDLLPAGTPQRSASHIINSPHIPKLLDEFAKQYDVIVLDTPPLLALADALTLGKFSDGILMVVEAEQTSATLVEAALRNVRNSGVNLIGFVLNKMNTRRDGYYYYYNYRDDQKS